MISLEQLSRQIFNYLDPILIYISLMQQGISNPEFYGDLVYRIRKIEGKYNFSE